MIGFLLVGGRGSRLGGNKPQRLYRGRPLWTFGLSLLHSTCTHVVLLGRSELPYSQWLESEPGQGPLGALVRALSHSPAAWSFILAVDYPELTRTVVEELCAHWQPGDQVILPRCRGQLHPLCGLYHRRSVPALESAYRCGQRSVTRAVVDLARLVEFEDGEPFHNVNEPGDLRGPFTPL